MIKILNRMMEPGTRLVPNLQDNPNPTLHVHIELIGVLGFG